MTAFVSFALLFLVMWLPVQLGHDGWREFYSLFLLVALAVEAAAIIAALLGIVAIVLSLRERHGPSRLTSWIAAVSSLALAVLALPTLYFGVFPYWLFVRVE